jgi:hypothetical protein
VRLQHAGRQAVALGALLAMQLPGCKAQQESFYARVWPCDSHLADPQCGTSKSGASMTCFAASSLGGQDFCTESCDPLLGPSDPRQYACLSSGAQLELCDPVNESSCPLGFQCFRTSADPRETDSIGLCIMMPVCTNDDDCAQAAPRTTCGGDLLRQKYPNPLLRSDHLQCVQICGRDAGTSCSGGESCLADIYTTDDSIPNICVPNCGAGQPPCPPNFFCLAEAGPAYPAICVPGSPGRRCSHEEDCMVGSCVDTGAGFSVCAVQCSTDDICKVLDGPQGKFFCAFDGGPTGNCFTRSPFGGSFCFDDADCPGGRCSTFDPFSPTVPRSVGSLECHPLCTGPGTCSSHGGVPYLCMRVDDSYGECYPGDFGLPCSPGLEECIGQLKCIAPAASSSVQEDAGANDGTAPLGICTAPCDETKPCSTYHLTSDGYCEDGICRPLAANGKHCTSSEQCRSGNCGADATCH